MQIIIKASAAKDVQEIFDWYEDQQRGLGEDFLEEFEALIPYLQKHPVSFRVKYKSFRMVALFRFPYLVWFRIEKQSVIIHAVVYAHRAKRKLKL